MSGMHAFLATAAAALALVALPVDRTTAQSSEYQLQAENPLVQGRGTGTVDLRLVHRTSGKVIDDATIVESDLEMPMNGMTPMSGRVQYVPVQGTSALRFVVSVPMEGEWLLAVIAKVPGEAEPIRAMVPVYVEKSVLPHAGTSRRWR